MRALVQRVSQAHVEVDGNTVGGIGAGLAVLLGIRRGDSTTELQFVLEKCLNLRIFTDADGKMNRSLLECGGQLLIVSQFTLYGDCRKGRRPSFIDAAAPDESQPLYDQFIAAARARGIDVAAGIFGAAMQVHLINDGPVTVMIEKEAE